MTEIRYRKIDPPSDKFLEEYVVLAGKDRTPIGRVGRRKLDRKWDAIPEGKDLRIAIGTSRADALGALMDDRGL